jgi:hypothetical protein
VVGALGGGVSALAGGVLRSSVSLGRQGIGLGATWFPTRLHRSMGLLARRRLPTLWTEVVGGAGNNWLVAVSGVGRRKLGGGSMA